MKFFDWLFKDKGSTLRSTSSQTRGKAITNPVGRKIDMLGWLPLVGSLGSWRGADEFWGEPMNEVQMEYAFEEHPIIRACVEEISSTSAEPRIELQRKTDKGWSPVDSHPVVDLLENPHPNFTWDHILQSMVASNVLTGYGYWWKIRGKGSRSIINLWHIPTSAVSPVISSNLTNLYAGFHVGTNPSVVPVDDIIQFASIRPSSAWGGSSAMSSCERDYQIDRERENYIGEMLFNMKVPGLVWHTKRPMSPIQKKELREDIESNTGRKNRGNSVIFEGEGEIKILNPLGDLDWPGLSGLSEARMCASFGVPPILISARVGLDTSTYSNYDKARVSFYRERMAPIWNKLGKLMTKCLLLDEGIKGYRLVFRYDELPEFQAEKLDKSNRVVGEFKGNLISQEEGREQLGYKPEPEVTHTFANEIASMSQELTRPAEVIQPRS